jgi:hypothetical protein
MAQSSVNNEAPSAARGELPLDPHPAQTITTANAVRTVLVRMWVGR